MLQAAARNFEPTGGDIRISTALDTRQQANDEQTNDRREDQRYDQRYDQALVARMAQGDGEALAELHDRHSRALLGIGMRMLRSREDAEEIVQETFLYLWRRARHYDGSKSSVWSWLSLILRSRCIDRIRHRRLHRERQDAFEQETETTSAPEGWGDVLSSERTGRLRQALHTLPVSQRRVLELSYFGGLTQTQVAEQEQIPLGTVKTRTLLAMRKLRGQLDQELSALI